jgi:hypothetical protein
LRKVVQVESTRGGRLQFPLVEGEDIDVLTQHYNTLINAIMDKYNVNSGRATPPNPAVLAEIASLEQELQGYAIDVAPIKRIFDQRKTSFLYDMYKMRLDQIENEDAPLEECKKIIGTIEDFEAGILANEKAYNVKAYRVRHMLDSAKDFYTDRQADLREEISTLRNRISTYERKQAAEKKGSRSSFLLGLGSTALIGASGAGVYFTLDAAMNNYQKYKQATVTNTAVDYRNKTDTFTGLMVGSAAAGLTFAILDIVLFSKLSRHNRSARNYRQSIHSAEQKIERLQYGSGEGM